MTELWGRGGWLANILSEPDFLQHFRAKNYAASAAFVVFCSAKCCEK